MFVDSVCFMHVFMFKCVRMYLIMYVCFAPLFSVCLWYLFSLLCVSLLHIMLEPSLYLLINVHLFFSLSLSTIYLRIYSITTGDETTFALHFICLTLSLFTLQVPFLPCTPSPQLLNLHPLTRRLAGGCPVAPPGKHSVT